MTKHETWRRDEDRINRKMDEDAAKRALGVIHLALANNEAHALLRAIETAHAAERTYGRDRELLGWVFERLEKLVRVADQNAMG